VVASGLRSGHRGKTGFTPLYRAGGYFFQEERKHERGMLQIRNWETKYETHESRKYKRLDWVCVRTDLADLGYRMLIDHPEGAAHLGAWLAIIEIASRCKPRGTLIENGIPLTAKHLAMKSGLPEALLGAAIPRLLDIGWLENTAPSGDSPVVPGDCREVPGENRVYITEHNNNSTEQHICASADARLTD
jgi:hypothetical protein